LLPNTPRTLRGGKIVQHQSLSRRVDDIILEHIVRRIELDLKLPAAGILGVVVPHRVIHGIMEQTPPDDRPEAW
jgi:hypothetical protein